MEDLEINVKIQLNEKWNVSLDWGWIPITHIESSRTDMIEVFDLDAFCREASDIILDYLNYTHPNSKYVLITEDAQFEICSIEEIDFSYGGVEQIITTENADFCIYSSHESSVTVGSKELLDELKKVWSNYNLNIWKFPCIKDRGYK